MNDCKHFLANNWQREGRGNRVGVQRRKGLQSEESPSTLPFAPESGWGSPSRAYHPPSPQPTERGPNASTSTPAGGHRPMRASCDEDPGNQAASPPPRRGDNSVASPPSISRSCNQHQPQKHSQKQKTCVVQVLPCQDSAFPRASDATGMSEYTLCGGRGHLALCPACSVQAKSRLKAWSSAPSPGHGGSKA